MLREKKKQQCYSLRAAFKAYHLPTGFKRTQRTVRRLSKRGYNSLVQPDLVHSHFLAFSLFLTQIMTDRQTDSDKRTVHKNI